MQFNSIEIENFGTIGRVVLELQNRGLVLVTGVNKDTPKADSNGAGKSLLLDAFCWAVWGRTVREDKDDAVVNTRVGKNCKVSVHFSESGKDFTINRYRKHEDSRKPNDLELFLDETELSSSSIKTTQDVINNLMGLTFETFCAMMPGAGKSAAQMTDSDIKELLENMLQITALSKARKETTKRLAALATKIQASAHKLEALDTQILRDRKRHADLVEEESQYSVRCAEKVSALALERTLAVQAVSDARNTVEAGAAGRAEVERIAALRSISYVQHKLLMQTLETIETESVGHRTTLRADISEAKGKLSVHKNELAKANELGTHCGACDQDIGEDHVHQAQKAAELLVRTVSTDIEALTERCGEFDREGAAKKAPILAEVDKLTAKIEIHNSSISVLNPAIEAAKIATAQLPGLEKAVDRVAAQLVALKAEESPYEAWIAKVVLQIEVATTDYEAEEAEFSKMTKQEAMLDFWKKAFSPSGIRSFILDNVTPVLNESAAHYCDILTDGEMSVDFSTKTTLKSGETRERFNINIKQKHGGSSYKSNSRGERQRANLVTSFALSDLAELHSNKRVDFRFLDEPFEGIDESGTDAVVALLQEQQTRYPTVFVVTHQSHFKEVFPQEIAMVKEGGMSHLEE